MLIIGMTGGIGCGKSEVCRYLEKEYDAALLFTDLIAHEVMEPGTDCYRRLTALFSGEMREWFPDGFLLPDGHLDRKKIGDVAFHHPQVLEKMNAVIHPAVWEEANARIRKAEEAGKKLVILESALLIGTDYRSICTEFWYVFADEDVRIRRLLASRDLTEEKAKSIMARQCTEETFRVGCDFVVDNSGDFAETAAAIDAHLDVLSAASLKKEAAR